MSDRTYDITLDCGCMISLDGGGGLIPCCYPEVNNKEDKKQMVKCTKAWNKYRKSKAYKIHEKEIQRRMRIAHKRVDHSRQIASI